MFHRQVRLVVGRYAVLPNHELAEGRGQGALPRATPNDLGPGLSA